MRQVHLLQRYRGSFDDRQSLGLIANAPDVKKGAITVRGLSSEVNSLKRTECPRELRIFTGLEQKRHDPGLVAFIV